jgi:threonine dehydratase
MPPVALDEIRRARERLEGVIVRTPLLRFGGATPDGISLWLKAESLQRTGSFKFRGAYNAIAGLSEEERQRGVITYSSGNHGQAVACAAHLLGVRAVVVMPEDAIPVKVELTRRWGAEIEFAGHTSLDRQARAFELIEEHGYAVLPPFDDRRIIAGQGTAGLEILEQLPEVDAVVVPVGGGGLISGISTAIKTQRPEVRVIGAEPEGGADAKASLETGTLVTLGHVDTIADGLRTSRIGDLNFATIRECVDEIVAVSDEETLRAVGILANEAKLVVEPSGAVTTAAVLFGHTGLKDLKTAAVISGGNVDPARLRACLAEPALAAI